MAAPADEPPTDDDEPTPTEPDDVSDDLSDDISDEAPDAGDGGGDGPEDGPPPMDVVRGRLRRVVPGTALGLALVIFLMGVAAAFSGAVLYAYYESRQEATTNKVDAFVGGFADQLDAARKIVKDEGDQAKAQVQNQLDELQKFAASGSTLTQLAAGAQPSIYFVSTLDSSGAPSVGTAFVAFSDAEKSYLLTSYTTIAAATAQPGPDVVLRRPGADDMTATLFTWDQSKDLALLSVPVPNLTPLKWADGEPKVGDRIFALSGLGSTGVGITQGFVADVSLNGMQHDVPLGPQFQGGPIVNSDGQVVAVSSRSYSPLGFAPDEVWFALLIRQSCGSVFQCPDNPAATPSGAAPPTTAPAAN